MTARFEDEYRLRCARCAGCGWIASTEDGEPWSWWDDLPPGSNAAVIMGEVYPLMCPTCAGRGYTVPDPATAAALDDVIAAALGYPDDNEEGGA